MKWLGVRDGIRDLPDHSGLKATLCNPFTSSRFGPASCTPVRKLYTNIGQILGRQAAARVAEVALAILYSRF